MQLPKLPNWSPRWSKQILKLNLFPKLKKNRREYSSYASKPAATFSLDRPNTRKRNKKRMLISTGCVFLFIMLSVFIVRSGFIEKHVVTFFTNIYPKEQIRVAKVPEKTFEENLAQEIQTVLPEASVAKTDTYTISVVSAPNLVVLFNPEKDLDYQLRSLQTIITQSRIEKKQLKKIDLRFDKIALEYIE